MLEGQNTRIKWSGSGVEFDICNAKSCASHCCKFCSWTPSADTCRHFVVDFLMAADLQAFCLWALSDGVADGRFRSLFLFVWKEVACLFKLLIWKCLECSVTVVCRHRK